MAATTELETEPIFHERLGRDESGPSEPTLFSAFKVEKTARNIMVRGNVLKFLTQQAQRNHIGDTDVIKHLIASICATNSLTSKGIQPELNGEKGYGKTDACKAVFHLIPSKWGKAGSISAKALYYFDLLPGSILFSDDIQWNDDLKSTFKRSTGNFQEPQVHYTLDAQRKPFPHEMPERLAWWLSSVESVDDDQAKDRQYSLDIDESSDHMREVSDFIRVSRSEKVVRFSVDWRIATARKIIEFIKEHEPFKVVIDCAKVAEWKAPGDTRTHQKFWDLVEAFAILRYKQRYIDSDDDGWLHATVEDFNEAKTIFMRRKENHQTHLTNAQTKIVRSVIVLQNELEGATQSRIAEDLRISLNTVSKSLKAIEANTRYIVHDTKQGTNFYRSTVVGLEVLFCNGDIITLPESYKDPNDSPIFNPSLTHDSPIFNSDIINNSKENRDNKEREREKNTKQITGKDSNLDESSLCPEKGVKEVNRDAATQTKGERWVNDGLKAEKSTKETLDKPGIGPNPLKYALPLVVRFLKPCDQFVGEDLQKLGEVTNFGPYLVDDVATLPKLNATILIMKGVAVESQTLPKEATGTHKEVPDCDYWGKAISWDELDVDPEEALPDTCVEIDEIYCNVDVRARVGPDLHIPGKMKSYGPYKRGTIVIVPRVWVQALAGLGYFKVIRAGPAIAPEEAKA